MGTLERMRTRLQSVCLALTALLVLAAAPVARAQTGPAYSVPAATLAAALDCPHSLAGATRAPVLLIPGTDLQPKPNFDWNYEPALTKASIPWCTVTLPRYALSDIQVAAEYVVYALRHMHADAGRRVSIVGWSQGGMIGRWALKYWPDTRPMLEDLVGLAPSNHGTTGARTICATSCPPAFWQQRDDAKFIAALNQGGETFSGVDYTVAYTHDDEIVQPNADATTGSSALRTGSGAIANIGLQDICPNDTADHFALGSYDPVGWAIAFDALTHTGPASAARLDRSVCAQSYMPGVDPATFPADYARFVGTVGPAQAQSEYVPSEPPLKCYVTGTCPGSTTGSTPAGKHCTTSRSRVHLVLSRRVLRAHVAAGSRHYRVHRRAGRLRVTVPLRSAPHRTFVRLHERMKSGRLIKSLRSYRRCA
jgi:triacylglycerol esterase/lipase EstA (alpha/beta hydrolase family)